MDGLSLESMPLERIEAEITEGAGHLAAAECRWLLFVAEFDRREGWKAWGCRGCTQWLSWRCGIEPRTARRKLQVAHGLVLFPRIREEYSTGRLSYSKARALIRVAGPDTEAELVEMALHATAAHVEAISRGYLRVARAEDRANGIDPRRCRRVDFVADDDDPHLGVIIARLTVEEQALVRSAMASTGDDHSFADALVMMAESFLADGPTCRTGSERAHLNVNVDEKVLLGDDTGKAMIEGGWAIERDVVGEIVAIDPAGRRLTGAVPTSIDASDGDIAGRNRDRGLDIDPTTAIPQWGGESLDLGWAVTSLWYANHPDQLAAEVAA